METTAATTGTSRIKIIAKTTRGHLKTAFCIMHNNYILVQSLSNFNHPDLNLSLGNVDLIHNFFVLICVVGFDLSY